jgi:hypothetical protein
MPQGKIDKYVAGCFDLSHHIPAGTQVYGWGCGLFNGTCDQSDRLMVQRSGRHQEDRVCLLFIEYF